MSILKSTNSGQYTHLTLDVLKKLHYEHPKFPLAVQALHPDADGWKWHIKNLQIKRKINTFERIMDVIYVPMSLSEHKGHVSYIVNLFHDLQYKFKIETFGDYFLLKKLLFARTKKSRDKIIVKILENEHSEKYTLVGSIFIDPTINPQDIVAKEQKEKKEDIEKFKFFNGIGL